MMNIKELLPLAKHERTSCTNEYNNAYPNSFGHSRCGTCAVLFFVENEFWPSDHSVLSINAQCIVDDDLNITAVTFYVLFAIKKVG